MTTLERAKQFVGDMPDGDQRLIESWLEKMAEFAEKETAKLREVLRMANIEVFPDGSHQFKPKAIKYYCGEKVNAELAELREKLEVAKDVLEIVKQSKCAFQEYGIWSGVEWALAIIDGTTPSNSMELDHSEGTRDRMVS